MDDNNNMQGAPVGFERFGQLEERIVQAVEEIKAIRKESEDLRDENGRLNERLDERGRENEALRDEIEKLTVRTTGEIENLRSENGGLQQQIAEMRQTESEMLDALAQFEKEREELRDRVEKTLSLLTTLDDR